MSYLVFNEIFDNLSSSFKRGVYKNNMASRNADIKANMQAGMGKADAIKSHRSNVLNKLGRKYSYGALKMANNIKGKFSSNESAAFNLSPKLIPEYGKDHSIGPEDGESRETSKMNIPALLSAKTAGGHPFPNTLKNDPSNHMAPDVFRLSK